MKMRTIDADALKKQFEDRTLEDFTCYHFIEAIDNAPTLPEEDGKYLLWGIVTENEEGYYSFIGDFDSGCEKFGNWNELYDSVTLACVDSEFFEYYEVIAWMPLPKPYK